ncbi:MAG: hypothetical protein KGL58_07365, partial [Pseudomonadota bacterium]|nr:hypothetical protein [Pseudomonadota bacterium]
MLNCVWNKVVRKSMLAGWLVFLGWLVPHEALALNLTVSDVSGPNFSFHGLKLSGDGYDKTGPLHLSIAQLSILGQHLYHVQLDCTSFQWTSQKLRCQGELGIALRRYRLRLFYRFDSHMLQLTLKRPHQQFRLKAKLTADWQIKAKWNGVQLDMLDHLLLLAHHVKITSGRFSGVALVSGKHKQIDQMRVQMAIHNMAFSDASGNHAADKEQFHVLFAASRRSQALDWAATVRSEQGELYFQPVYLNQAGDSFKVKGTYSYGRWKLAKASLFVPGAGKLSASGEIDFFPFKIHQVNLVSSKISLARAWPVFVAPFVAPDSVLSDSVASGYLGFMAKIHEGQPVQLHVQLFNVSLVNHGKSWAIRDVSADFPWDQHRARTASVHFGLSHWRKI